MSQLIDREKLLEDLKCYHMEIASKATAIRCINKQPVVMESKDRKDRRDRKLTDSKTLNQEDTNDVSGEYVTNIVPVGSTNASCPVSCEDISSLEKINEEIETNYNKGMNDAWEMAKNCFSDYSDSELNEVFGSNWNFNKIMSYTPQEVQAKIDAWKKDKTNIRVGDIVKIPRYVENFVVTAIVDNYWYYILSSTGIGQRCQKGSLTKTGEYVDVANFLKQIGGSR